MGLFKYFALLLDIVLALCYEYISTSFSIVILIPPLLHILTFVTKPHCYAGHCHPKRAQALNIQSRSNKTQPQYLSPMKMDSPLISQSESPSPSPFETSSIKKQDNGIKKDKHMAQEYEYQQCGECGLPKWVRMHHCYYCGVCVHKYDHHCVLLGLCIGEANQKYYLPFLWLFLITSVIQALAYYGLIGDYLWLDQKGYEHVQWPYVGMSLGIIFFIMAIIIVGYLAVYHTYLVLHNNTTYEMRKRPEIYYFRGVIKGHPFDQGLWQNLKLLMNASSTSPIEWQLPERPKIMGLQSARQKSDHSNIFDDEEKRTDGRKGTKIEYHQINLNNIKL